MKKGLVRMIAAAMALSLFIGSSALAAKSPTSKNNKPKPSSNTQIIYVNPPSAPAPHSQGPTPTSAVVSGGVAMFAAGSTSAARAAVPTSNGSSISVAIDQGGAALPQTGTSGYAVAGNSGGVDATFSAVTTDGRTAITGAFLIRGYSRGVSLEFMPSKVTYTFGVGNAYEGQTLYVYVRTRTGKIAKLSGRVSGGRLVVSTEYLGNFVICK